jgi:hypothetical protein
VSEKPEVQRVEVQQIQIDPDGRYLLVVSGMPVADFVSVQEGLIEWWESGEPICLLSLGLDAKIEFVRVDDEQESS